MSTKKKDMLETQRKKLEFYQDQFDVAVSAVTKLVECLSDGCGMIDTAIGDIELYQEDLEREKDKLISERARREKVISNFNTLLNVE